MIDPGDGRYALDAWTSVASDIVGEAARRKLDEQRSAFVATFVLGGAARTLERAVADQLSEVEWTWPWFEEWERRFDEMQIWPVRWPLPFLDEYEVAADYSSYELASMRRRAIAPLIVDTAFRVAYRSKHISQHVEGWGWRLVSMPDDEAELAVARGYRDAIEGGDLSFLPPFFPSDRTSLQSVPRRRPYSPSRG